MVTVVTVVEVICDFSLLSLLGKENIRALNNRLELSACGAPISLLQSLNMFHFGKLHQNDSHHFT